MCENKNVRKITRKTMVEWFGSADEMFILSPGFRVYSLPIPCRQQTTLTGRKFFSITVGRK